MLKTYLGDSVYAEVELGMIKLTTNNGYDDDPRNVIFLEPEVCQSLLDFVRHLQVPLGLGEEVNNEY